LIKDENDNAPRFFVPGDVNVTVPETVRVVRTFNATAFDLDIEKNGDISYNITGDIGMFINSTSFGLIRSLKRKKHRF